GLTNKYNIWASTLDRQDVEVMHDRIKNGANLLDDHVFQFDFLNDDFSKLPKPLQDIINNPKKRKKLVVYINPPYAETSGSLKTTAKKGVNQTLMHKNYKTFLERANHELYAQFLARIYNELNGCIIAEFSKIKSLQGSHFKTFRDNFLASLEKMFIVPADTFDNVKGQFPIGFKIWDTKIKKRFTNYSTDVYDFKQKKLKNKNIFSYDDEKGLINKWIKSYQHENKNNKLGEIGIARNDIQNKSLCWIGNTAERGLDISYKTLIIDVIFFAVQACIKATWLNDRDQFLYPNDGWKTDKEFQNDCLAFTLFHGQNRISSTEGTNHWIPFTEKEVNSREKFESNFMSDFIKGKSKPPKKSTFNLMVLFETEPPYNDYNKSPLQFSTAATAVFNAGLELWKYYHRQPNCNVNASLYDIREHFQGRNEAGKMNNKSSNETYMKLIGDLREQLGKLANKIEPKVYEYEFLKE
ncbi:MAG: hypothetical protein ORN85_01960, partial [Sediminibacterium sp.]|nr:hypothetical protein [Sediminibacterium sp.]